MEAKGTIGYSNLKRLEEPWRKGRAGASSKKYSRERVLNSVGIIIHVIQPVRVSGQLHLGHWLCYYYVWLGRMEQLQE